MLEDFTANRLPASLRGELARRLRRVHAHGDPIALEALRAVEPAVARYLARS